MMDIVIAILRQCLPYMLLLLFIWGLLLHRIDSWRDAWKDSPYVDAREDVLQ